MRPRASVQVLTLAALLAAAPSHAQASGGASADGGSAAPATSDGGSGYGTRTPRAQRRPLVRTFRLSPATVRNGRPPAVAVRVDQRTVPTVAIRVTLRRAGSRRTVATLSRPRARTGRLLRLRWPRGTRLRAGRYVARLYVRSPDGATLRRLPGASGTATVTVAAKPKARSRPKANRAPAPSPAPAPAADPDGTFPVGGPYTLSGPGGGFGADRDDHRHEGFDILASTGTPVLAPLPGTIITTDYQRGGAGFYVAMDADDGRAFFFAHCRGNSTVVSAGERVAAGQRLCLVGQSGRATGPHLHFEIWVGGWRRDKDSHPVDPLPQLKRWAG